jgi:uncharacterized protein (TIGR00369 family)
MAGRTTEMNGRTRTVTWQDPLISAAAARGMSGIDFLRAMVNGKLPPPPIGVLLGMSVLEVEPGRVVFGIEPDEYHYNPIGVVHGGVASTLCDSAMGCAIQSTLPAGVGYTTLELHVNFVRPLTRDTGPVRCEAEVIHVGGRTATAQARLLDREGKLYSHATTTCIIFRPEGGQHDHTRSAPASS